MFPIAVCASRLLFTNLLAGTQRLWHGQRWPPELDTDVSCELEELRVKPLPLGALRELGPVGQSLPHKS